MKISLKELNSVIRMSDNAALKLAAFNEKLREYFGNEIDIFCQASDGWVIMYRHDDNVPLAKVNMKHLLTLNYDEACNYLDTVRI